MCEIKGTCIQELHKAACAGCVCNTIARMRHWCVLSCRRASGRARWPRLFGTVPHAAIAVSERQSEMAAGPIFRKDSLATQSSSLAHLSRLLQTTS